MPTVPPLTQLLRPGDWLVLLLGGVLAAVCIGVFWRGDAHDAHAVVIRSGGKVVAQLSLLEDQHYRVVGPLGASEIEVRAQRARVAVDPSPRQLCVRQGWIARSGESAICLPNQLSIQIAGTVRLYDSLNF